MTDDKRQVLVLRTVYCILHISATVHSYKVMSPHDGMQNAIISVYDHHALVTCEAHHNFVVVCIR